LHQTQATLSLCVANNTHVQKQKIEMLKTVKHLVRRHFWRSSEKNGIAVVRKTGNKLVDDLHKSLLRLCDDGEDLCINHIENRIKELQLR
jgi:hypothetical protein